MKMVRCNFASQPNTGQPATSLLATNATGDSAEITQMSSQETWLERISAGRESERRPTWRIRTPISAQRTRWHRWGMRPLQPQVEGEREQLQRRQQQREREEGHEDEDGTGDHERGSPYERG